MADYAQLKTWDDEKLSDTDLNAEVANLYTAVNNVGTNMIAAGAVTLAKAATAARADRREGEHGFDGYVVSGWRFSAATTLSDCTLTAGIAYVLKTSSAPDEVTRIDRSDGTIAVPTLTASATNYVFLKSDNTLRVSTTITLQTDELLVISLVTDGTTVTSNTFLAPTNPFSGLIGSTIQHFIDGMELQRSSTTAILLKPGAADVGGIISSTANISLTVTTASWLAGASSANQKGYAYISNNGSNGVTLSVSTEAPDLSDVSDNTAGQLRYQKYGSTYYRYVGSFRQDGSSNLIDWASETPKGGYTPFIRFQQTADTPGYLILNDGASTSPADIDCSPVIPATTSRILVEPVGVAASGRLRLRANGGSDWEYTIIADLSTTSHQPVVEVFLDSNLIFEYSNQNAAAVDVYIVGFWDAR